MGLLLGMIGERVGITQLSGAMKNNGVDGLIARHLGIILAINPCPVQLEPGSDTLWKLLVHT